MNYYMENKIFILDSNVFVWAFYEWDSLHNESIMILESIWNAKIIVPYCVVQS